MKQLFFFDGEPPLDLESHSLNMYCIAFHYSLYAYLGLSKSLKDQLLRLSIHPFCLLSPAHTADAH